MNKKQFNRNLKIMCAGFMFLTTIFSGKSIAQVTQTIRGTVADQHTKSPLPGATIVILNGEEQLGAISDSQGIFKIDNVSVGRQSISISYIGHKTQILDNLLINSGKELILNIELEEIVIGMDEIKIVAYKKHKPVNDMATLSARSFTVEETQKYAGTRNDPSRMAANYAGVLAAGDQRNDIIIRGNSPLGLLWRMNGVNIPNPNHFGGLGTTGGPVSMINSKTLMNSDFYTGAFPGEYGNALSGVFDLKMRSGNRWKREYMTQLSFDGLELAMEGPFSKSNNNATYLANYRYSTWEIIDGLGIQFGPSAIPKYQDASFKVDFFKTKIGKISLWGFGGTNKIEMLKSEQDPEDWSFGHSASNRYLSSETGVIALSHLCFFNENTHIDNNISLSGYAIEQARDSVNIEDWQVHPVFRNNSSEIKTTFSSKLKKKFNVKNYGSAGISFDLYTVSYSDSAYRPSLNKFRTITEIENEKLGILEVFVQWQHKFSDVFKIYTGLHYQYFTLNDHKSIEPRFNLTYSFANNQSFGFSYGLHSQLQPRNIYFNNEYENSQGNYIKTNEDLGFSKAHHFVLGYDNLLSRNLRIKAEAYYQYLYNIPVDKDQGYYSMLNSGDFFRIQSKSNLENTGTGDNYGIELTIEKFLSHNYYYLFTTSLFQSKYKGGDGIERNTAFNGNYAVNALGGYEIVTKRNNAIYFDINGTYAGGKRYIPVDEAASISTGNAVYDYDRAYEVQYPDYFRVDFKVSYKINKPKVAYSIALDVQNITNHKNIFSQKFDPATGQYETDYQQGLFPILQLKFEF